MFSLTSIPFTTCTALKQLVSVFAYFFFPTLRLVPSLLSRCLLPPLFLYFLQNLQSVQANLGLCRSAASPTCVVPAVVPVLFTKPSLNYRVAGGGYSLESSFHLCNVVYRHAHAAAVHSQTTAAHLLTPFLAPQLTHFSHTPPGCTSFFFSDILHCLFSLCCAGVGNCNNAHLS